MSHFSRLAPILLIIGTASADFATQTDWSGGPGVTGPWGSWDDSFEMADGSMNWGSPGEIGLEVLQIPHSIGQDASNVLTADIDGDGDQDIVCRSGSIEWVENPGGSGASWISHPVKEVTIGARFIDTADLDGDGDPDILHAVRGPDQILWMENDPANPSPYWSKHIIDADFEDVNGVSSGDYDGDGDMDAAGAGDHCYAWWENTDGSGTGWIEHPIADMFSPFCVHTEDMDGDGDADVLGASPGSSRIDFFENDGTGSTWIRHPVALGVYQARWVCTDDVDGDGDMDVIGAVQDDGYISWWENLDGQGTSWVEHQVDPEFLWAGRVHSADLDDDGDVDILGTSEPMDQLAWWENVNGFGTLWHKHVTDSALDGAGSVTSGDIDGDGVPDIVGSGYWEPEAAWWKITDRFQTDGTLTSSILYLSNDPGWGALNWTAEVPAGTSVAFQVRAGDDPYTGMGSWSDTLHAPTELAGMLEDGASYFQYRVLLQTADSLLTPLLEDITVEWDPLGVPPEDPLSGDLLEVLSNPASAPIVRFTLGEASDVRLVVLDLSGRIVDRAPAARYGSGSHEVLLGDLPPGVYFCSMRAGDISHSIRFVVVE